MSRRNPGSAPRLFTASVERARTSCKSSEMNIFPQWEGPTGVLDVGPPPRDTPATTATTTSVAGASAAPAPLVEAPLVHVATTRQSVATPAEEPRRVIAEQQSSRSRTRQTSRGARRVHSSRSRTGGEALAVGDEPQQQPPAYNDDDLPMPPLVPLNDGPPLVPLAPMPPLVAIGGILEGHDSESRYYLRAASAALNRASEERAHRYVLTTLTARDIPERVRRDVHGKFTFSFETLVLDEAWSRFMHGGDSGGKAARDGGNSRSLLHRELVERVPAHIPIGNALYDTVSKYRLEDFMNRYGPFDTCVGNFLEASEGAWFLGEMSDERARVVLGAVPEWSRVAYFDDGYTFSIARAGARAPLRYTAAREIDNTLEHSQFCYVLVDDENVCVATSLAEAVHLVDVLDASAATATPPLRPLVGADASAGETPARVSLLVREGAIEHHVPLVHDRLSDAHVWRGQLAGSFSAVRATQRDEESDDEDVDDESGHTGSAPLGSYRVIETTVVPDSEGGGVGQRSLGTLAFNIVDANTASAKIAVATSSSAVEASLVGEDATLAVASNEHVDAFMHVSRGGRATLVLALRPRAAAPA